MEEQVTKVEQEVITTFTVVRRNFRLILQYLVNACMLVDWLESIWSLSPAIFSRNGPSSDKVSSLPIKSYLTGQGGRFFVLTPMMIAQSIFFFSEFRHCPIHYIQCIAYALKLFFGMVAYLEAG